MTKKREGKYGFTRLRLITLMCVVGLAAGMLALAGCGSQNTSQNASSSSNTTTPASSSTSNTPVTKPNGKVLVVYYSATDTTKGVAQNIANDLGGDLFAITPVQAYTSDDLNWNDQESRVVKEHQDPDGRHVALTQVTPDAFDSYQTVFIGYPIWWGDAAWTVDDFIKGNDFSGKTVIPFCTSLSSPLGSSGSKLATMAGTGNWQEGMRFGHDVTDADVQNWLKTLNLQ